MGSWDEWDKDESLRRKIMSSDYELDMSAMDALRCIKRFKERGSKFAPASEKLDRLVREISKVAMRQVEKSAREIARMLVPRARVAVGEPHNMSKPLGRQYTPAQVGMARAFDKFKRTRGKI